MCAAAPAPEVPDWVMKGKRIPEVLLLFKEVIARKP